MRPVIDSGTPDAEVRCALCDATGPGTYRQLPSGALTCAGHPWCDECQTAHLVTPCQEQLDRIHSDAAARDAAEQVLAHLDRLGIVLPRVPVHLTTRFADLEDGRCVRQGPIWHPERRAEIQIRAGLGPTRFGQVAAHEHTHALLHLSGRVEVEPALEEGVCELVAVVWLTSRQAGRDILRTVWANPDPVYGGQMRRVVRTARRVGVGTVIQSVLVTGRLP